MEVVANSKNTNYKPHAVCVPLPFSTHINHLLKLAKHLHYKGFHVTFANSNFFHETLLSSKGPAAMAGLPDFRFESYNLNYTPQPDIPLAQQLLALRHAIRQEFLASFSELLARLNDTSTSNAPPVTCIVADGVVTYAVLEAEKLGIPIVLSWNVGANGFLSLQSYRDLMAICFDPDKDVSEEQRNKHLDTLVDFIPGHKDTPIRDLPKFIQGANIDSLLDSSVGEAKRTSKASALIFYTFEALEKDALHSISSMFPRAFSIGPLPLQCYRNTEESAKLVGHNIWKEDSDSVKWLDSKDPNSVIYVSFGTTTTVTPEQIVEFAWGLANSGYPFLWIIPREKVEGVLPPEFIEEILMDRGKIKSWCEQEKVLNHPATGGFLTHCGWNSVLESVYAGVPMICWPFMGEHMATCKSCCNDWGLGLEIDKDVNRENVAESLKELMEGERGRKLKSNAKEWKKKTEEAIGLDGSSSMNLDKLVNEVLLGKH